MYGHPGPRRESSARMACSGYWGYSCFLDIDVQTIVKKRRSSKVPPEIFPPPLPSYFGRKSRQYRFNLAAKMQQKIMEDGCENFNFVDGSWDQF